MSGRIVNVRPKPGFVVDSAGGIMPMSSIRDGALTNFMSGRGTSVDRSVHNWWTRSYFMPEQVEAAYLASWLMRKVVDVPAEDQTREGRDWDADSADIEKIEAEEKRLSYWQVVRLALTYGRLGGGAIFINTGDDPAAPRPETVKLGQVVKLVPLHRTHLTLGGMDDDLLSPYYGEPVHFRVNTPQRPLIHASRLVVFKGEPVPGISFSTWEDRFWGQSIVQVVDKAVKDATTATDGFASLIDEAKVDVFTMPGMYETLAQPGGSEKFMAALQATAMGKSVHRMLALGEGETWETRELTWTGMPDMITTYLSVVAGAADIPATRLLGKSPDGMNATGEGDLTNYYDGIASRQESDLRPALEHLDKVVLPSAGVDPKLPWNFSPLRVLTPQQLAEVEYKEAQSLKILVDTGMFSEVALEESFSNRMIESERWPGYKEKRDAQIQSGESEPSDEPDDLGIVPIPGQPKGGDPRLGQPGGNAPKLPAPTVKDAQPRTLYVRRDVVNVADIEAWRTEQGLPPLQDGLHVTICHIDQPFDWMKIEGEWNQDDKGQITIQPGGVRIVEPLGNRTAVLLFTAGPLSWRHEQILRAAQAEDKFPQYQPHISLTGEPVDLSKVEPYRGKIVLGPEIFEPTKDDFYSMGVEE